VSSPSTALIKTTVELIVTVGLAFWIAGVWWVYRDARRRLDDWVLVAVATAAATLFGVVGVIVYQLVRPIDTRADRRERESLERILALGPAACPACGGDVDAHFRACPHCAATLKTDCPECERLVGLDWRFCPGCAVPLAPVIRAPRVDPAPASAVARRGTGRPRVYHANPLRRLARLTS
jgi:double zinc ribbon protein